jgi:hypothetical protein
MSPNNFEQPLIIFYTEGSRKLNNLFWALFVILGGLGFLFSGLSSFFKINFLFFLSSNELSFVPQGIVLLFYGTVGLILGFFLCLTVWWDIGFGYNEYSKENQKVTLYRKGFPGENREMRLKFNFEELKSIKMFAKDGLSPKRQLFLCLTDNREFPLTGRSKPAPFKKFEMEALNLAKYLNICVETD